VEPGDVAGLSQALYEMATAPKSVRAMASACIAAAYDYTLEAVTDGYRRAYETGRP
jgi:hypothetical protein